MTVYTQISQNNWPSSKNQFGDYLVLSIPFSPSLGIADIGLFVGGKAVRPPKSLTTAGAAAMTTTQSKFYGGSISFNDTTGYITVSHPDFYLTDAPFTIEFWYRFNADGYGYDDVFFSQTDSSAGLSFYMAGDDAYIRWGNNPSWNRFNIAPAVNTWYHLALVREGTGSGQTKMYFNGVSQTPVEGAFALSTNFQQSNFNIGRFTNIAAYENNGYMQDYRVYRGLAKYTANFTPPGPILGSA